MAYIIGLCGGIGSGKSAVSHYLEEKGYPIVDADIVAREVVRKGSLGLELLVAHFGKEILSKTGELDRTLLGELVFNDEEKRSLLNHLLHPLIEEDIVKKLHALENEKVVFLVVPLFYEAGYERYTDEVFFVSADESLRLKRIQKRDESSAELALKKIKSQLSEDELIARFKPTVIKNNTTLDELKDSVDALLKKRSLEH